MKPIRAVVLAGNSKDGEIIKGKKISNKAFYPINKKPMLHYVLDILLKVKEIEETVVVGPVEELKEVVDNYKVTIIPHQDGIIENVMASKNGWENGRLLIVTSDIPMITTHSIEDFIHQTSKSKAQLFYPIIERKKNEEVFPGVNRTYVTLLDGTYTGGNISIIDVESIEGAAEQGKKLVQLRKSPLRLANFLGWFFLFKLITKRLSIEDLENRVSTLLNLKAKAVISPYPQLGTDVDKDSDIDIAEEYLKKQEICN